MPSHETHNHTISYLELDSPDLPATKRFYSAVFGWTFKDYGANYTSFTDGHLGGGFCAGTNVQKQGLLLVIYAKHLAATEQAIVAAGGTIVKPTFPFPGGRRFHFADPVGNVLAVWSE